MRAGPQSGLDFYVSRTRNTQTVTGTAVLRQGAGNVVIAGELASNISEVGERMSLLLSQSQVPGVPTADQRSADRIARRIRWHQVVRPHVVIWTIVACSTLLAIFHLCTASIWYDEALTLLTVSGQAQTDFAPGLDPFQPSANLVKITGELYQQDVHPPLYFWTLALWRVVLGESLEAARALSALFLAGTLLLLHRLASDLNMQRPWVPSAMFAASGVGLQYAYNARPYAMAAFLIVSTLVLAQRKSRWTGICGAAAIATHYFAALCVAPILAISFWKEWKRDRLWAWATISSFAIGVAPLLLLLRVHLTARPLQYPGFGPPHKEFYALLKSAIETALPNSGLPGWGFAWFTAATIACLGIWHCYRQRKAAAPLLYAGFLLGFFLMAVATQKSIVKMPGDYYLGIGAPLLALLIGFGLQTLPRVNPLFVLLIVAGMASANPIIKSTDYRAIAERMRMQCSDCTVVVGNGYAGAVPASVLYETKRMKIIAMNAGETADQVFARAGNDEFVLFVKTNEPPTVAAEDQFVLSHRAVWKDGYFEVYPQRRSNPDPQSIHGATMIGGNSAPPQFARASVSR